MPDLTIIADFINRVGFPVACTLFLLWREDRCLEFLQSAHLENRRYLQRLVKQWPRPRTRRKRGG